MGIETSCDETAAALVDHSGQILAQRISSQIEIHREWGGIVPELAARDHLNRLMPMINEVLDEAGLGFADLDAIAATCGPGLIGSILVGAMTGRTLAWAHGLPFLAINHLEGHALSPRLTGTVTLPCLLLLASGGHSMFVLVHEVGRYQILGQTLDDAAGEAFDKTARLLGLGWPGGPAIEQAASQYQGQKPHFILPRPMIDRPGCDLSFAGLKSAVRRLTLRLSTAQCTAERSAIASAFQDAVCDVLAARSKNAIRLARMHAPAIRHVVIAGGVA
ncbi:MAG: tRNA (adenosine(37)-N6)-threonylcarbamoyltransferase complex transferase subunit TsaD, partial [Pseudomonadota bacterium]